MNVMGLEGLYKKSSFLGGVLFLCVLYSLFEFFVIPKEALTADEFVFARHIYEYTYHIPYRDFSPYKSVLGYYLLSIPMFFSHTLLEPIFSIKKEIILINAICIVLTGYWAEKIFNRRAVALSLLAITFNQIFIIYASDLRVDMLTSWLCLFAILAVLDQKIQWSGLLISVAFLISQKAIWYWVAINGGLLCCELFCVSTVSYWRLSIKFNAFVLLPMGIYIAVWSWITHPDVIWHNLFYDAYVQAGIHYYSVIYLFCWQAVLRHGPILFLLWPLTGIIFFIRDSHPDDNARRVFSFSCGSLALLLFISYQQAFPYNFVFTLPALFILYANFFSYLPAWYRQIQLNLSALGIGFFSIYLFLIVVIVYGFHLPSIYYLTVLIPVSLYWVVSTDLDPLKKDRLRRIFFILFFMLGLVLPLIESVRFSFIDGRYQQTMIYLTEELLADGGDYVGGIPFLYNKDQPIEGMKNLITPAIDYLSKPTAELKLLLLPSLYLTSTSTEKVLDEFEKSSVKVIINTCRISLLPSSIHTYMNQHYKHYYGSIYLYAPIVLPNRHRFPVKFNGQYRIEGKSRIRLDAILRHPGEVISLQKGVHVSEADEPYRLVLIPRRSVIKLNPYYQNDDYIRMNKGIVV